MDSIQRVDELVKKNIIKYTCTNTNKLRTKTAENVRTLVIRILKTTEKRCFKIIHLNYQIRKPQSSPEDEVEK